MTLTTQEKAIRTQWFINHSAHLETHGDLQILKWEQLGTTAFKVRFVFDENYMYVSGDIGSAVFRFTEKADFLRIATYNMGYFVEKLQAFSGDIYQFDNESACSRLEKWKSELLAAKVEFDETILDSLIHFARSCQSFEEWEEEVSDSEGNLNSIEEDCAYWISQLGHDYHIRLHAYLFGLRMAAEQLQEGKDV